MTLYRIAGVLAPAVGFWLAGRTDLQRTKLAEQLIAMFMALAVPSPNAMQKKAIRLFGAVLFRMMAAARLRGNDVLWQWGADLLAEIGGRRAPVWAEQMKVDSNRLDQMVALQDREDELFGVTGSWEVRTADCAIKVETACPFAACASVAPELCTEVVHRFETETYRALNPSYTLDKLVEPLLSTGGKHCRFVHRLSRHEAPANHQDMQPDGRLG